MEQNYRKLYESLSEEHLEDWMTGDWLTDKKRFMREQETLNNILIEYTIVDDDY